MRPLVRWTIGGARACIETLKLSVHNLRRLYGDAVDYVVCYNHFDERRLRGIDAPLFDQSNDDSSLLFAPTGEGWKFYPPRLRIEAPELFVENDLVLFAKPTGLDRFFAGEHVIYTEGLLHAFGVFKPLIPANFRLNAGLFGIPAGFDLGKGINRLLATHPHRSWTQFDDQGVVAVLLKDHPKQIVIPLTEVSICHSRLVPARCGHHFVGLNKTGSANAWECFQRARILLL